VGAGNLPMPPLSLLVDPKFSRITDKLPKLEQLVAIQCDISHYRFRICPKITHFASTKSFGIIFAIWTTSHPTCNSFSCNVVHEQIEMLDCCAFAYRGTHDSNPILHPSFLFWTSAFHNHESLPKTTISDPINITKSRLVSKLHHVR